MFDLKSFRKKVGLSQFEMANVLLCNYMLIDKKNYTLSIGFKPIFKV